MGELDEVSMLFAVGMMYSEEEVDDFNEGDRHEKMTMMKS